jgi:putative transposase
MKVHKKKKVGKYHEKNKRNSANKKARKAFNKKERLQLHNNIIEHNSELWKPSNVKFKRIESHSWFDLSIGTNNIKPGSANNKFETDELPVTTHVCKKKILKLNPKQKKIIQHWMNDFIRMYNATVKYIKTKRYNNEKCTFNFKKLRTKCLKNIKERIWNDSIFYIDKHKITINRHILDGAIKDACTSYKSALSNLRNKHIRHFNIRYIKSTKKQKIIRIEKTLFSDNNKSFCRSVLGDIECMDGTDFSDVTGDTILMYNLNSNRYTLLIPDKPKSEPKNKCKNAIGLDPGIRTFLTGYTNGHLIEVGNNMQKRIVKYLKQINSINDNEKLSTRTMRKTENKRYNKLANLIDDLHWKSIKYLTDNYKTILIGNLSTKGIGETKLNKTSKNVAKMMRLYVFRQRLQYKCSVRGNKYKLVKENYTTKMCTNCGINNNKIGAKKEFSCPRCKNVIGRDANGARNMYIKSIM